MSNNYMTHLPPRYKTILNRSKESHESKAKSMNNHHSYYPAPLSSRARNPQNFQSQTLINKSSTINRASRNGTWNQVQVIQDIVQVLKEQNLNLKQQNHFLLQKLRAISKSQQENRNKATLNQNKAKELRRQNQHIKDKIQEVNSIARVKVEEFGKKLIELSYSTPKYNSNPKLHNHQQRIQMNARSVQKLILSNRSSFKETQPSQHEKMQDQFDYLLSLSKIQQDPLKKKQYRKKLVELTNRMRQVRS